jgi:hypothetical protein
MFGARLFTILSMGLAGIFGVALAGRVHENC